MTRRGSLNFLRLSASQRSPAAMRFATHDSDLAAAALAERLSVIGA